jgi:AcrR family transcriptional regulator
VGSAEDSNPADNLLPLPPGSGLDVHKRAAIVRAAIEVYRRDGWDGVTVSAVEAHSDVSRRTIIANVGDRNGLAAAIWSQLLPDLRAAVAADVDLTAHRRISRHLHRMVELVRAHPQLTGALLAGVLAYTIEHGPPTGTDPADPRTLVPLPAILRPVLLDCAEVLRPGLVDDEVQATDTAALLTNTTLHLAITRPSLSASDVTGRICDTMLAGMLLRRPGRW